MVDLLSDAGHARIIRRHAASEQLYTDEEFNRTRAEHFADTGFDPMLNGMREGDNTGRWWYHPPWGWTRPWLPRGALGSDEFCNPTVWIVTPFMLGTLVIRYKRKIRGRADGVCDRCIAEGGYPNCPLCGYHHWPTCVPVRVVCQRCHRKFGETGDTGRFATYDGLWTTAGRLYCSEKCADHKTRTII
jgi:hypothetical protein